VPAADDQPVATRAWPNLVIGLPSRDGPVNLAAAPATTPATRPAPGHLRHHPTEQPPMRRHHKRAPEPRRSS
jgi:hypothetical protein